MPWEKSLAVELETGEREEPEGVEQDLTEDTEE